MKNINLNNYILVSADSIEEVNNTPIECTDITVENNHNFLITDDINSNFKLLTHNCDGHHISSLLVNLFYRWFPYVIRQKKLASLVVPLLSYEIDGKKDRFYCYSLVDYKKIVSSGKRPKNVRYLKGLGSNDVRDWENIFKNMEIEVIREDSQSKKYLDIAFGKSSEKRKQWLSTEVDEK